MPGKTKKQKLIDSIYENGIDKLDQVDSLDHEEYERVRREIEWDVLQVILQILIIK